LTDPIGPRGARTDRTYPANLIGRHVSTSESDTAAVARALAGAVEDGDWILLSGPLGAGKTAFVRGLAEGLGVDPVRVHSPTFTLVAEYPGRRRLAHVDLYRIAEPRELEELGLADLLDRAIVVAVEWGERVPAGLVEGPWRVTIEPAGSGQRLITIERDDAS
jgi:tRNA threonylcarbamoyladenosine biosynthesis protein TsaE